MITPPKMEHYGMKIGEGGMYEYYVHSSGYVWRRNKNTGAIYRNTIFMRNDKYCVKIDGRSEYLHVLIAKVFLAKYYKEGYDIVFKNGDRYDCNVNNLAFEKRSTLRKRTNKNSKKIVVEDEEKVRIFKSTRAAARWLKTSHQLISMIAKGEILNSYTLKGYKIYYLEDSNEEVKRIITRGMRKDL